MSHSHGMTNNRAGEAAAIKLPGDSVGDKPWESREQSVMVNKRQQSKVLRELSTFILALRH